MADMTPPPLKPWRVVVDSPFLSRRHVCEVEARTEIEAKVRAAEVAVTAAESAGHQSGNRAAATTREDRVTETAGYAVATAVV